MTKSARQLVNLCQLANLVAANWRDSPNDQVSPPTGEPHCRQLVNLCQLARFLKMTKSLRQLVNLVAANWRDPSK